MKKPTFLLLAGVALLVLGLLLLRDLWYPQTVRTLPAPLQSLLIFGPAIIVAGLALALIGLVGLVKKFTAVTPKSPAEQIQTPKNPPAPSPAKTASPARKFGRLMLFTGITMVVFGLCPWWWLDILTSLGGGRPGGEGTGLFGFFIMIFIGLPGLLLTIISWFFLLVKK